MPTAEQIPGRLNLAFNKGDFFSTLVDFSINLSGRTFTADLISVPTRETLLPFTVAAVDLEDGQLNVSLSGSQTDSLAVGTYEWRLCWNDGGAIRTALEGYVEVS